MEAPYKIMKKLPIMVVAEELRDAGGCRLV